MAMALHNKPPNWVKAQSQCNVALTFEALTQILRRDVEEANKLEGFMRKNRKFRIDENSEGTKPMVSVKSYGEKEEDYKGVVFTMDHPSICVVGLGDTFYVRPVWNPDIGECEFCIQESPVKLWKVSERALSRLFFG